MKLLLTFIAILLLMPPAQLLSEDAPPGRNDGQPSSGFSRLSPKTVVR